jgi:hypothetical protein
MQNPKYLVNISHQPSRANGQQLMYINGVTSSFPSYSSEYFLASMPELKIAATGSTYQTALQNLLNIATASTFFDSGNGPLNSTRSY